MIMWIWLGISISLLLLEILRKKLNLAYLIFAAILVLTLTKLIDNFLIQFIIFVGLGLILHLYHDKITNKIELIYKKDMLGRKAKVVKAIKKGKVGIVKINKIKYKAISLNEIKENSIVKIIDVSEFILRVEKVNKEKK